MVFVVIAAEMIVRVLRALLEISRSRAWRIYFEFRENRYFVITNRIPNTSARVPPINIYRVAASNFITLVPTNAKITFMAKSWTTRIKTNQPAYFSRNERSDLRSNSVWRSSGCKGLVAGCLRAVLI